jgi:hypothetical protein
MPLILADHAGQAAGVYVFALPWLLPLFGILKKPLHKSLKEWYSRPGDRLEVALDGFVIDIVREDLLIEIQTGNFAAIKAKLTHLARTHRV